MSENPCQFNVTKEMKELFSSGDLEKYLILNRGAIFENQNDRQIDLKIVNKKIGCIYNIDNFNK